MGAMMPERGHRAALLVVLAVGLGLRLVGLFACEPYYKYTDEGHTVAHVARALKTGAVVPGRLAWGPLPLIASYAATEVVWRVAAATGGPLQRSDIRSFHDDGVYDAIEPPLLIGVSRGTSVLVSMLTILVCIAAARRLTGCARAGVLAGALLAVSALHVQYTHFAAPDVYAGLFATVVFVLAAGAGREPRPAVFVLMGLAAGLAAASKASVGLVVVVPAVLALLDGRPWRARMALVFAVGLGIVAGYVAGCPWVVTGHAAWRSDLAALLTYYERRSPEAGLLDHLKYLRLLASSSYFGWAPLLAGLAGLVVLCRRRPPLGLALMAFALPYVVILSSYSFQRIRNMIPVVVLLALGAAYLAALAVEAVVRKGRVGPAAAWTLMALVLVLPSLWSSVSWVVQERQRVDARETALDWLVEQGHAGGPVGLAPSVFLSTTAVERRGLQIVPMEEVVSGRRPAPPVAILARPADPGAQRQPYHDTWDASLAWLDARYRAAVDFGVRDPRTHVNFFTRNDARLEVVLLEQRADDSVR